MANESREENMVVVHEYARCSRHSAPPDSPFPDTGGKRRMYPTLWSRVGAANLTAFVTKMENFNDSRKL